MGTPLCLFVDVGVLCTPILSQSAHHAEWMKSQVVCGGGGKGRANAPSLLCYIGSGFGPKSAVVNFSHIEFAFWQLEAMAVFFFSSLFFC